jgi:hypothetical protein
MVQMNDGATVPSTPLVADRLEGFPFFVQRRMTFDRLLFYIGTGEAGKYCRIGIYSVNADILPSALVLDGGAVSIATAGVKTVTISQQLQRGWYYFALLNNTTPVTASIFLDPPFYILAGVDAANPFTSTTMWSVAQAYGALPNPFTGGGAWSSGTYRALIRLRVLSWD